MCDVGLCMFVFHNIMCDVGLCLFVLSVNMFFYLFFRFICEQPRMDIESFSARSETCKSLFCEHIKVGLGQLLIILP